MKFINTILLLLTVHTFTWAQFVDGQVYKCINRPTIQSTGLVQDDAFPFWIKIKGDYFILSDSNNKRLSQGGSWTYCTGKWEMKEDSLLLHINDLRRMSTHTGIFSDQIRGNEDTRYVEIDIKFIFEKISEELFTLVPLRSFLGYREGISTSFPSVWYLDLEEKLQMKTTSDTFYFDDKL